MTAALSRRTRWLLVAGALLLALLVNLAWVAFGPSDRGDRGAVESAVRKTWTAKGTAPRNVSCSESSSAWTCRVESARGDVVICSVGTESVFLANPEAALRDSCSTE